jgi:hypothetical protein
MLKQHEVVPPLSARTPTDDAVHAWDFKQKKNLVIAFLHSGCRACDGFLGELSRRAKGLAEREAVALAIFSEMPWGATIRDLPNEVLVAADTSGHSQSTYLGEDVLGPGGQRLVGVFITDRYGELYTQWVGREPECLPRIDEVFEWLEQIELACDEDGVSDWAAAD